MVGAGLAALSLEGFLAPNHLVDGGMVGFGMMGAYLTHLPLWMWLLVLNMPFLVLGASALGLDFAWMMLGGMFCLSTGTGLAHTYLAPFTKDILLSAVFGGAMLGAGVGLVLRCGGCLDGMEVVALILDRKTAFSVGEVVMVLNVGVLGVAAFVFGLERALYSLLTYVVAFRAIDLTMEGLDDQRAVIILTQLPEEVTAEILKQLGKGVTMMATQGGFSGAPGIALYTVLTRLETPRLKSLVLKLDPGAFITVLKVHEVVGGRMTRLRPVKTEVLESEGLT